MQISIDNSTIDNVSFPIVRNRDRSYYSLWLMMMVLLVVIEWRASDSLKLIGWPLMCGYILPRHRSHKQPPILEVFGTQSLEML